MPLSLNDLAGIVKLAWHIQNVGSSKYTSGPREFREFLEHVNTLETTLQAVELANAANSSRSRRNSVDLNSDFLQSVIKESSDTLISCKHLIEHNNHFIKNKDGYITNIIWTLTIADHVHQHQDKIQICFHKANFALQRHEAGSSRAGVDLILGDTGEILSTLKGVERALNTTQDAQNGTTFTSLIPEALSEMFTISMKDDERSIDALLDAVLLYHDEGTVNFKSEEPFLISPSVAQYTNLMKCIWLMEKVKVDSRLRAFCRDNHNAAWARQLDRVIRSEAMRFSDAQSPLERVSDEQIMRQDETAFRLNPFELPEAPVYDPLKASIGEVPLLRTNLRPGVTNSVEEIRVFRVDESRIRVARSVTASSTRPHQAQHSATTIHEQEIDGRKAYLNPIYAISPDAAASIAWKAALPDHKIHELSFSNLSNARSFQEFITNFGVVLDETAFDCARKKVHKLDGDAKKIANAGRVQVWLHRDPRPSVIEPMTNEQSSNSSRDSRASLPQTLKSSGTWTESTLKMKRTLTTVRSGEGGAFLVEPVPSQVIIMSEHAGSKVSMSIRIDEHVQLAPEKCRCSKRNSTCQEVVLRSAKDKLRLVTSYVTSQSESWNVALFSHPKHESLSTCEQENVRYVFLHFTTLEARKGFVAALETTIRIVKNRVDAYHKDLKQTRATSMFDAQD